MGLLLRGIWRHILKGQQTNKNVYRCQTFCNSVDAPPNRNLPDATMLALRTSISSSDVLATVQRQLPSLTHKHLLLALKTLFELQKDTSSRSDNLIKDPAFVMVCQNFKKHARMLDTYELVDAIKILVALEVPVDSLLVQTLLQLVRVNINELNIRQVMFLDFLLKKFNVKNHLVDALLLALPLVFQIHLPIELDKDDLPLLRDMLNFSTYNNIPGRCINNIVTGILLHEEKIDVNTARSILWALCEVNCTVEVYPTRVTLLNLCFQVLTEKIDSLSYKNVLRIVSRLRSRILEKHPEYYNEKFMDAVADYVVENGVNLSNSILIARSLSRIAHTHLGLAEYICDLAASDSTSLATAPTNLLFGFINFLSNNNFIPKQSIWTEIKRQLTFNRVLEARNTALPWTKFSLELASLGYYDDRVLSRVFSEEFLQEYLHRDNNTLDYLQILTLHEAVKVFHDDKQYTIPENVLEKAKSLYPVHIVTDMVASMLARGLGGQEYVAKNVVLPSGIIIDLLVCLDNGSPINIAAERVDIKTPLESLKIPKNASVVCITNFNQGCYAINSNRLRGNFRLIMDMFEKQGFTAIPLKINDWLNSPDKEKIPYLLQEIKFKCKDTGMKLSAT